MSELFKGFYGAVTIGERGQLVIPSELRKELKISAGHKLMVFADVEKRVVNIVREEDFAEFLQKASQLMTKLEDKIARKGQPKG